MDVIWTSCGRLFFIVDVDGRPLDEPWTSILNLIMFVWPLMIETFIILRNFNINEGITNV